MADPINTGIPQTAQTDLDDIAARVEHHTDRILRASGSGLRNYTMHLTRRAILTATMDLYEEAYRAGVIDNEITHLSSQTDGVLS